MAVCRSCRIAAWAMPYAYAHDGLLVATVEVFDPVVRSVPLELRAKLEPAEVMHQLLEHRWYLSEARGQAVPLQEVVDSYVDTVLRARRDEDAVALHPTTTMLRAVPPADED